jgi:hypothetical protein
MAVVNATGTTGLDTIARNLVQKFDQNKDGKLSTDEFMAVLSALVDRQAPAAASPWSALTAATPATAAPASTSSAAAGSNSASNGSGSAPRLELLAGFDHAKFETSKSTKYKFARAAAQFDLTSVKDKTSAEALLKQMKPAMEKEGLEVLEISKDRIKVTHEGKPIWVDVIRAASTGVNCAFQWLPDEA